MGGVREVQVIPSGLVMMPSPEPSLATAAKRPSVGDQATDRQARAAAAVRAVQVIPSGLVITRLVPDEETETKSAISEAHVTL